MRDGSTRQIDLDRRPNAGFADYQRHWQVSLVLVSGDDAGSEYLVEERAQVIGRGTSAELRFREPSLSSEHATLEFTGEGYRVRDLGSRNGTLVNGVEVKTADLKNGDELRLGSLVLRYLVDERLRGPRTYQVPIDLAE